MNRKYEVLLLLNPNLEKSELKKLISDIEKKMSGNIIKKEEWGIKDLSYVINKSKKAYYVLYYIETTSENINLLKEMISITKNIIRPMILRHEKKWPYEYKNANELKFPERKPRREFKPRVNKVTQPNIKIDSKSPGEKEND